MSFAIIAEHFPKEIAGRANAALNLLHVGGAFVLQSGIGIVIGQWTPESGRYPSAAYQTAFALNVALQVAALLWFVRPERRRRQSAMSRAHVGDAAVFRAVARGDMTPYEKAARAWGDGSRQPAPKLRIGD